LPRRPVCAGSRRDHTSGRARPSAGLALAQERYAEKVTLREEQPLVSGSSQNDRRRLLGGLGGGRLGVFGLGVPSTRRLVDRGDRRSTAPCPLERRGEA